MWPDLQTRLSLAVLGVAIALFQGGLDSAPAADPLALPGIQLGMPLAAWKALPIPDAASKRIEPVCTDRAVGGTSGLLPPAADLRAGEIVCGCVGRSGRFTLPETFALGPRIHARRLRFTFLKGRLASVEYRVPADNFDDVTARLAAQYGPAVRVSRDSVKTEIGALPRVREIWRTPQESIDLTDPVQPYSDMSIRFTAAPARAS